MLIPTIIMAVLALVLLSIGWARGDGAHVQGIKASGRMVLEILPMLVCSFLVAGMVQTILPKEMIAGWIGAEAGLKGIFIGAIAGGLAPGGPYVSMPVAAGLLKAGAGLGTMVAFLTGWSLWAVARMPLEVGIMGWKFTLVRLACVSVLPPIAGLVAHLIFEGRVDASV